MNLHFRDVSLHTEIIDTIQNAHKKKQMIHMEIGFGSGIVLRDRATRFPDDCHMGFELKGKFLKRVYQFAEKHGIENLSLFQGDVKYLMPRFIPMESIDRIYIYYPDPWWKKKHKKYILFDYDFMADLYRALKPGGILNIKTDVVDYYDLIKERFDRFGHFKKSDFKDSAAEESVSTFEQKGVSKGHILNTLALQK